jgi:hypothetical protein
MCPDFFALSNWAERRPTLAQAVMAPLICWSFSSSMFKYRLVDHAVPTMCRDTRSVTTINADESAWAFRQINQVTASNPSAIAFVNYKPPVIRMALQISSDEHRSEQTYPASSVEQWLRAIMDTRGS